MIDHPAAPRSLLKLVLAVGLVFGASFAGQLATATGLIDWYPRLAKPWFTPPNVVFPIAWSLLFALMALAFWRVLRSPSGDQRNRAVMMFLMQLALNVLWSWVFFGLRNPLLGIVVIVALDIAVALTMRLFLHIDRAAGWMLAPYLAWIAFATVLNGAIYLMN